MKGELSSKSFTGHNGKVYQIFEFFQGGRGWKNWQSYAVSNHQLTTLTGRVEEPGPGDEWAGNGVLKFFPDTKSKNVKVQDFAKRPYVSKKTGLPGPHFRTDSWEKPHALKNAYACLRAISDKGELIPGTDYLFVKKHDVRRLKI